MRRIVSDDETVVQSFPRSIAERARRFRWRIPTGEGRERYLDAIESVSTVDELFAEVSYFGNADL